MIAKGILMFGHPCVLICDAQCSKAWGANNRPRVYLGDPDLKVFPLQDGQQYPDHETVDLDDYAFLADHELGQAPIDPGTYEGDEGKPISLSERLNKWCARECERSEVVDDGEPFELPDFSKRQYNREPHTRGEVQA